MPTAWTDEQRVKVLAALAANGGNISATAREMGIPASTIRLWRDTVLAAVTEDGVTLAVESHDGLSLADKVGREIGYIGFGNLSDIVSWDEHGRLRFVPSADLTPAQAAIISEIRVKRRHDLTGKDEDATVYEVEDFTIKTRDKLAALRVLAEITGLKPTGGTAVNVAIDNRSIDLSGLSEDALRARIEAARMLMGDGEHTAG